MNTTKDTAYSVILGQAPAGGDHITQDRGHIMTIAPFGSAKANALIIPNLLHYSGPVVVVDPTGDYYTATAEKRRAMGQKVYRIDPFGVIGGAETDSINPGDLISPTSPVVAEDCRTFVTDVLSFPLSPVDYWERLSVGFAASLIGYICTVPEKKALVRELVKTLNSDDVVYALAVVLDTIGKKIPKFAYSEISAFLQNSDPDRSRIVATTYSYLQSLTSEAALKSLDNSDVPLDEVTQGESLSIYLMVPPAKLVSHSLLLRVWMGTLLACVHRQPNPDAPRTLFILDECAQLGAIPLLTASIPPWERGNLLLWTFWQDVDQARNLYSPSWTEMPDVVQLLAAKSHSTGLQVAAFLGIRPEEILSLLPDEQIVRRGGVSQRVKTL